MTKLSVTPVRTHTTIVLGAALCTLGAGAYFSYNQHTLLQKQYQIEQSLAAEVARLSGELTVASNTIAELNGTLLFAKNTLIDTEESLRGEQNRNEQFANEIKTISGTVATLDKLAKTDEELLQKYSKVFFLNEHYEPPRLQEIANEWKYSETRSHQLHSEVMPFFEDMLEAAKDDGVDLYVVSAYRSFDTQAQLKASYTISYGSGANAFSADQGYSEHQLGTAVDFTTTGINGALTESFEQTEAYEWLSDNAHLYGFTLSYPRGNQYYIFEPWHWRFVGRALARDLKRDDAHFYDWEQRQIDEYLVKIFD